MIKEFKPNTDTLSLDDIIKGGDDKANIDLAEIEADDFVCSVYEVDEDGEVGTLIYVPSVAAETLFPNGGDE